tara:strand:+ start:128942 stop:129916 length:975 start_codon:yes stop_codon:yes gene_type:complete
MSRDDHNIPVNFESDDSIGAQALVWFVRLRDDEVDPTDAEAFMGWLEEDLAHAQAYAEIKRLWCDLDVVAPQLLSVGSVPPVPAERAPHRRLRRAGGAIAASVALLLGLEAPQLWVSAIADARTGIGEVRELTLADGTHVVLDADSAIDVAIDADRRRIRLLKGRAWFNVAYERRPFTVATGGGQIRDIGTAFEVARRSDGGEVAVTEGVVELTAAGGKALQLSQGMSARFDGRGHSRLIEPTPGAATWRQGRLQFVDMRLSDLLEDLSRYGAGSPVILDADLTRRRITGVVDLHDPVGACDAILTHLGARGRRFGPWLFVSIR